MVDYGPQAPKNTTSHGSRAQMGVSRTHGVWTAALQRCALCILSVVRLVRIVRLGCVLMRTEKGRTKRQQIPGTYVQNKPSGTETRGIVLSTPAEKTF